MAWVRIDDNAPDHRKILALEDDDMAFAMWTRGLCHCNRLRTGGFIAVGALRRISAADHPALLAAKLAKVGLWEAVEGGFQVHDYDHYQGTQEVTKAKRAVSPARQEAGRRGGQRSGEARRSKLERSQSEATTKADGSRNEAGEKPSGSPDEAPGKLAPASDPDPLPGSPSDPDHTLHTAGASEAGFEATNPGLPPADRQTEPATGGGSPEVAQFLAALRAAPVIVAAAKGSPMGQQAALEGLASALEGRRMMSARLAPWVVAAIGEAERDLASAAAGEGAPPWTHVGKTVAKYADRARAPRGDPAPPPPKGAQVRPPPAAARPRTQGKLESDESYANYLKSFPS